MDYSRMLVVIIQWILCYRIAFISSSWSIVFLFLAACSGSVIVKGTGVIKSPQFPSNYPPTLVCEWKLFARQGSRIILTFTDFEVRIINVSLQLFIWGKAYYILSILHVNVR